MGAASRITLFRTARNFALAVIVAGAVVRSNVAAQPAAGVLAQNALRIYVVNGADRPVALAEVKMSSGDRTTIGRTDSTGLFRADGLASGDWHASVRRIGYNETQIDLHVANGENAFTITVDRLAPVLTDVNVVEEKRVSLRLVDFEGRRARGEPNGVITREYIKKRNPISISQLLRALPGVQVIDDYGVKMAIAARGSVPGQTTQTVPCPMRISVDGLMRPVGASLDEVVPADVHGIEVYYGPARLPLQLATFRADKWCGLVAIWTRDK